MSCDSANMQINLCHLIILQVLDKTPVSIVFIAGVHIILSNSCTLLYLLLLSTVRVFTQKGFYDLQNMDFQ